MTLQIPSEHPHISTFERSYRRPVGLRRNMYFGAFQSIVCNSSTEVSEIRGLSTPHVAFSLTADGTTYRAFPKKPLM